jgi:hypothetical protein
MDKAERVKARAEILAVLEEAKCGMPSVVRMILEEENQGLRSEIEELKLMLDFWENHLNTMNARLRGEARE